MTRETKQADELSHKLLLLRGRVANVVAVHEAYMVDLDRIIQYLKQALADSALDEDTSEVPE